MRGVSQRSHGEDEEFLPRVDHFFRFVAATGGILQRGHIRSVDGCLLQVVLQLVDFLLIVVLLQLLSSLLFRSFRVAGSNQRVHC